MARGPPRLPWRDEPLWYYEKSPRGILMDLSSDLRISSHEVGSILTRTEKLKTLHPELARGRDQVGLILASAICYVRWYGSTRNPMPTKTFVSLCNKKGYRIGLKLLNRNIRIFREKKLYPQGPKASEILKRRWSELMGRADLGEDIKTEILEILNDRRFVTGKPETAVAAAVYVVCYEREIHPYQSEKDLAELFGTTDVTIRTIIKRWTTIPGFKERYSRFSEK